MLPDVPTYDRDTLLLAALAVAPFAILLAMLVPGYVRRAWTCVRVRVQQRFGYLVTVDEMARIVADAVERGRREERREFAMMRLGVEAKHGVKAAALPKWGGRIGRQLGGQ